MTVIGIIFISEFLEGLEGKFLPLSLNKISYQGSEHDYFPPAFPIWRIYEQQINPRKVQLCAR